MLKTVWMVGLVILSSASAEERLLVKTREPLMGVRKIEGLPGWSLIHVSKSKKQEMIRRLQQNPSVLWVEEDFRVRIPSVKAELGSVDPREREQWVLEKLGVRAAWSRLPVDSPSVRVAVIDTGVDISHPDLLDRIFINRDEVPGNGIDDDQNGFIDDVRGWNFEAADNDVSDDYQHGTHVAGIIGASVGNGIGVSGVSPKVEILPVRWMKKGSGWGADAIAAIHYSVKMGAKIINASWGGIGYSKALEEAVRSAEEKGVLFVASAGNGRADNDVKPRHPANLRFSNVVAVASTDESDRLEPYSNYGLKQVEMGAPGKGVLSTLMGNQYGALSGTSMAAASVSGVASLLLAINPALRARDLKRILLASGVPVAALEGKTISGVRLDADRASRAALESLNESSHKVDDADLSGPQGPRIENYGSGNLIRPDASEVGALNQGLQVRFVRRVKGVETPVEGLAFRAQTDFDGGFRSFRSDPAGEVRDPDCVKSELTVTATLQSARYQVSTGKAPYELLLNLRCGVAQKVIFEEDSEAGQAIAIWQTLIKSEEKLSVTVGVSFWRRQIEMIWPGKGDYYSGDVVNLTQGHYWDVVAHELGHAIYDQAGIGAFGGGQHYIDQCYSGALALSEGWASFFSAWVNLELSDPDARFEYMVKRRAPIRFENIPADVCGKSTNEWRVTGFLWDLIDLNEDGETVNEAFGRLWKDLAQSRMGSVMKARERLQLRGWAPQQLDLLWNLNFPEERIP